MAYGLRGHQDLRVPCSAVPEARAGARGSGLRAVPARRPYCIRPPGLDRLAKRSAIRKRRLAFARLGADSQRAEECGEVVGLLRREHEAERRLIELDHVVDRRSDSVVEIRCARRQTTQAGDLEAIEVGELAAADALAR